jgi:hypothetical protein
LEQVAKESGLDADVGSAGSPSADFAAVAAIEAESGEAETNEQQGNGERSE